MEKTFKKAVYERLETVVDKSTGEIIQQTTESVKIQDKEPEYIKLYLDCICAFNGLNKALSPILIACCNYMTWADSKHDKQLIFMNKIVKENICESVGIKQDRLNKALKNIVDAGIFRRIPNARGVYEVNPYIIAKGQWSDIKVLRANFDFINKTVEPIIENAEEQETED